LRHILRWIMKHIRLCLSHYSTRIRFESIPNKNPCLMK
jgi:hypothetical protein